MGKKKKVGAPDYAAHLPSYVNISGLIYDIRWNKLPEEWGTTITGDTPGKTGRGEVITLDPRQSEQHARIVFLHELMHACFHDGNDVVASTGIDARRDVEDLEELFIRSIDRPLLTALRDNPEWTKWLLGA